MFAAVLLRGALLEGQTSGIAAPAVPLSSLQPLVMDANGLLALYRFEETAGNLLDGSGNGNHGVVGTAPVRDGASYRFTDASQLVDFPAALNESNSFYFVVTVPPTPGGQSFTGSTNQSTILGSNGTTEATLRIGSSQNGAGELAPMGQLTGTYQLHIDSSNGTVKANTAFLFAGTHAVALVCPAGGGGGQFYLDGTAIYTDPFPCNNLQKSGNFRLGRSFQPFWPQNISYWAAAFYRSADSGAVARSRSLQLLRYAQSKGAPLSGQPGQPAPPSLLTLLLGQGDSILCGYGLPDGTCTTAGAGSSPNAYLSLAAPLLLNSYTPVNYGVPGAYVQDNLVAAPVLVDPQATGYLGESFAVLGSGTNNLSVASNVKMVWQMQEAWAAGRAVAGLRPVLVGLVSRAGSGCLGGGSCDAAVEAMNALQRAGWKQSKFQGYVDLGSDPLLGAAGASTASAANCTGSSTALFHSDGLHLCTAGHQRMAEALACVLNGIDGSGAENMNPVALTAASTVLGCGDGGRLLDPSGNAVSVTLPSAMWQTGREVRYCNVSSSGSNAATVVAPADFPFGNVSGRTSLPVPAGGCVRLRAVWNGSSSAPGDFWMTW